MNIYVCLKSNYNVKNGVLRSRYYTQSERLKLVIPGVVGLVQGVETIPRYFRNTLRHLDLTENG